MVLVVIIFTFIHTLIIKEKKLKKNIYVGALS